jgi:hypothetical protein
VRHVAALAENAIADVTTPAHSQANRPISGRNVTDRVESHLSVVDLSRSVSAGALD